MPTKIAKESYVVGREREDGTLEFQLLWKDLEIYPIYGDASNRASFLNQQNERGRGQREQEWKIYRMKFEVVE